MGVGALAALGVGLAVAGGGTALGAMESSKKRKQYAEMMGMFLPNIPQYQQDYFGDLTKYKDKASDLAREIGQEDLDAALAMREKAIPGIGKGLNEGAAALFPLLKGELPPAVLDNFRRAGAASSVGSGFGGSGFGDLNTQLFGARGSLAGMQLGFGMLPSLLGAMPNVQAPSTMSFLQNVMTPQQRTNTQLQVRGQNLGVGAQIANMPTGGETWANFMTSTGGMLASYGMMSRLANQGQGGAGGNPAGAVNGMGYDVPSNFGTLSPRQQNDYANQLWRNRSVGVYE